MKRVMQFGFEQRQHFHNHSSFSLQWTIPFIPKGSISTFQFLIFFYSVPFFSNFVPILANFSIFIQFFFSFVPIFVPISVQFRSNSCSNFGLISFQFLFQFLSNFVPTSFQFRPNFVSIFVPIMANLYSIFVLILFKFRTISFQFRYNFVTIWANFRSNVLTIRRKIGSGPPLDKFAWDYL